MPWLLSVLVVVDSGEKGKKCEALFKWGTLVVMR